MGGELSVGGRDHNGSERGVDEREFVFRAEEMRRRVQLDEGRSKV